MGVSSRALSRKHQMPVMFTGHSELWVLSVECALYHPSST